MQKGKRRLILIVWNFAAFAAVMMTWLWMVLFTNGEQLSSVGWLSLRYYTVLSNLLYGAVSLAFACALIRSENVRPYWQILKLTSASCVAVTFSVVMLFLGPLYGYPAMFSGANLWFHLLIPLAAAAEYVFLDRFHAVPLRRTVLCLVPTLLYSAWYIINFLIFGTEENDFYGFVNWGYGVGILILCSILGLHFALACLLRRLNKQKT